MEFGAIFKMLVFFRSGMQNAHLQENSALDAHFFRNLRHIPKILGR